VQALLSAHVAGQALPSQVSPTSSVPLPQDGEQSLSVPLLQPAGQQPSPEVQAETRTKEHAALQFCRLPVTESLVHAFPSLQLVGQLPSHVSPDSTVLFPQDAEQSPSLVLLHPAGQQPSPAAQLVMLVRLQEALQLLADPVMTSAVHATPSSHVSGQLRSHVSPSSTVLLPQVAEQSLSVVESQAAGQQPSPLVQAAMRSWRHTVLHAAEVPMAWSAVQAFPSSQVVGQAPVPVMMPGSHSSVDSRTPLPQGAAVSWLLLVVVPLLPPPAGPLVPPGAPLGGCVQPQRPAARTSV